ncbi:MAG: hypothetical protein DDT35_01537 [Firmicutes bacterium]|nr:hypothetical protein [Bacillota bacterium]
MYPVFSWEETHNIPAAMVSSFAWLRRMELLTGRINHAVFRTWQKGELLFMGCSGQHTGGLEKNCPVTFKFSSSRTATNMTIGDITGVHKEGHHYLWIEYQEGEIENRLILTKRPRAVYIERVYDYGDFTLLGINTPWR